MIVWIALWLACTSPDQSECMTLEDPTERTFEKQRPCMLYAQEQARSLGEVLRRSGVDEGVVYYTCVELKQM